VKIRTLYFFVLLICNLSGALAGDVACEGVPRNGLRFEAAHGRTNMPVAIVAKVAGQSHTQEPDGGQSGDEIRNGSDVAIHASVTPGCNVILSLIEVLGTRKEKAFPQVTDPRAQHTLFKVLFRVIIAPNAP
jgi:hypothetical protein